MLILTPDTRFTFHGRDGSPSDHVVVKETWVENVYRIPDDVSTVVDVGANIGAVTVYACSKGAHVVAVEPEPNNLELLKTNLKINRFPGTYTVVEAALAATPGVVMIDDRHGNSRIGGTGTPVNAVTLESVMIDCDVLKIDVEGSEYDIVSSTPLPVLRKAKCVALEFDSTTDEVFGGLVAKLAHQFAVDIIGSPSRGGYIYARRYD